MYDRLIAIGALIVSLGSAACAHNPASTTGDVAKDESIYVPPKLLPGIAPIRLESRSRAAFDATVEIPVDAYGRADVNSIRIMGGPIDDLMKRSLQDWLAQAMFVPAKRDGVPVAGVFQMRFRGR